MKVTGTGGLSQTSGAKASKGAATGGGGFRVAGGPSAPTAPAQVSSVSGVMGVEALLALQDVESPTERRRRSVSRAGRLLDELDELKVALLGCGVVGSEVARIMTTHADDLAARIGAPVELAGVAVRRPSKVREGIDPALITTDATALVKRGDIDVVVEVIGGIEPARTLITTAFEHGASVVSANKALLAEDGSALHAAAGKHGRDLYYEAAVAGGHRTGVLAEFSPTARLFTNPADPRTEAYITGRIG